MTISVWIILFVMLAFGSWIYYKKNKHIFKNKENKSNRTNKEYSLNRLDKMIENLANDQVKEDLNKNEASNIDEPVQDVDNNDYTTSKKNEIIKNSIILERRKKK